MKTIFSFLLIIISINAQWQYQHPYTGNYDYESIDFVSANVAYAVGYQYQQPASLIKTTNGGESWFQLPSPGFSDLHYVFFLNETTGWIAGWNPYSSSKVKKTTNGGLDWFDVEINGNGGYHQIQFLNENIGIVTEPNSINITTDGGASWEEKVIPFDDFRPTSSFFISDKVGWISCYNGKIGKTTDGGDTWHNQFGPYENGWLLDIEFKNENDGIAVGGGWFSDRNGGFILKTSDGGVNWDIVVDSTGNDLKSVSIAENSIYVTGGGLGSSPILKSSDNGSTWVQQMAEGASVFNSIDFFSENIGAAAGQNGQIFVTSNGGESWVNKSFVVQGELSSVFFINDLVGWAAGSWYTSSNHGVIVNTTDGGITWNQQNTGTDKSLTSICFINENIGWASGMYGTLLETTNGGETWTSLNTVPTENTIQKVQFLNQQVGYAIGEYPASVFKTTDGGQSWTIAEFNSPDYINYFYAMCFINENVGWVAGSEEFIFRTTDGGSTWTEQFRKNEDSYEYGYLSDIQFVDENNGWTPSNGGYIYHTSDGGLNWEKQYTPADWRGVYSVSFIDENTGWAVGALLGKILKTTNGGKNWGTQESPSSEAMFDVFALNDDKVWTVGWDAVILSTSNGGGITGVENKENKKNELTHELSLYQNYPNPFNPTTKIKFIVPNVGTSRDLSLRVYDILGREVKKLINNPMQPGEYEVEFNGGNLPSGIYFYRLTSGEFVQTRKMLLLK